MHWLQRGGTRGEEGVSNQHVLFVVPWSRIHTSKYCTYCIIHYSLAWGPKKTAMTSSILGKEALR